MTILEQTLAICKSNNIKPAKSKGQNFLIVEEVYDKIIEAAELKKTDKVLEIGPGLGFLTQKLSDSAGQVTAVELDEKLGNILKSSKFSAKDSNVTIMQGNALDLQTATGKYKIVANLPYNITSAFLRKFLSQAKQPPELMVLLVQKEVAERLCAKPGAMSLLAISVQVYAETEIIDFVPAKAFYPAPEVESAIIKIKVKREKRKDFDEKAYFQLVRIGFSARRKKLANNLAAGFQITTKEAVGWLAKAGFPETIRAQELGVEDWVKLLKSKDTR